MAEELLEKIPAEKRWEITSKIITSLYVIRGEKTIVPDLGKGEGFMSPVLGAEKWKEINVKIFSEGGKIMLPWVKDTFNIPVEDAIGTAKFCMVVAWLFGGPEQEFELIEATPERAVLRTTKCAFMERYKEFKVRPAFIPCRYACQEYWAEGLKAISPKITYNHMKALPWGDPYCEEVFEFKEG